MIRLTVFLCMGLFAALMIGGQDHGQLRYGLMNMYAPKPMAVERVALAAPQPQVALPVTEAAFVPVVPVMAPVDVVVAEQQSATAIQSELPNGRVLYVNTKSINVREGPGKDYPVLSRLAQGEAVLVVAEGEGPEGWSLIRIEGDGVEGYVASRLLGE